MKRVISKTSGSPTFSHIGSEANAPIASPRPEIRGYTVLELLGQGGMGAVWRAVQASTRREVALKVTHARVFGSQRARMRFEREVELAARLTHPHIARVYDSGIHDQRCFYVMEYVDGVALDQYVRGGRLSIRQVVKIMLTVSAALQYAHQHGVIHRDLKPSNILITPDGQPHILDFGLAKDLGAEQSPHTLSLQGDLLGTPAFMSPEQAAGAHDQVDVRSDIYTFGVMLYYLMTGQYPYEVTGPLLTTLKNIQTSDPRALRSRLGRCDSDLEALCLKTLAKCPDDRYQSIAELHHDLACWLEGRPLVIKSHGTWYLLRKIMSRHRASATIMALILIIIMGFLGVYTHLYTRFRHTDEQLEQTSQSLADQAGLYADLGQHVLLQYYFLPLWHAGKIDQAQKVMAYFSDTSREAAGARFLMDPNECAHKAPAFEQQLSAPEAAFVAFMVGEQHLKEGMPFKARAAYERCLSATQEPSKDLWLKDQARSRLYELGAQP